MPKRKSTQYWAKIIGKRIRKRRKELGIKLIGLSIISGSTVATLSNIERGKRDFKLSTLVSLAFALRINLEDLFKEENSSNENLVLEQGIQGYDLD